MRRILIALTSAFSALAVMVGVFGTTSPAYALNGYINGSCITSDTGDQIVFYLAWDNPTSNDIVYLFDTGIPGEPTSSDVASANTEDAIDFSRGLNNDINGQTYTMSIKFDGVVVFEADWVNACPWQGMTITLDEFTAASDPSPSPSESVTPTPTVEPTPTPTVEPPAPLAAQNLKAPKKVLKKGKTAKLAKTTQQGAKVKWVSKSKTCKLVKGYKLKGVKKGKCTLRATAPAVGGFASLSSNFTLRVK